jgi:hypothetical protein
VFLVVGSGRIYDHLSSGRHKSRAAPVRVAAARAARSEGTGGRRAVGRDHPRDRRNPALRTREHQIFAHFTDSLAALLATEQGSLDDAIEPWVVANALIGVHRALVSYARSRIVAGVRNPKLSRDVRAQGRGALAALERGLGGEP